jgi:hypothetical protein
MIYRTAPIFQLRIRPYEIALLWRYLEEASVKESSGYLQGFLSYLNHCVLWDAMEKNFGRLLREHAMEQAEAVLAEIHQDGEPHEWVPPTIEES